VELWIKRGRKRERGRGTVYLEGRPREGEVNLCNLFPRGECRDCPFLSCNQHPRFPEVQKHVHDLVRAGKKRASTGG